MVQFQPGIQLNTQTFQPWKSRYYRQFKPTPTPCRQTPTPQKPRTLCHPLPPSLSRFYSTPTSLLSRHLRGGSPAEAVGAWATTASPARSSWAAPRHRSTGLTHRWDGMERCAWFVVTVLCFQVSKRLFLDSLYSLLLKHLYLVPVEPLCPML